MPITSQTNPNLLYNWNYKKIAHNLSDCFSNITSLVSGEYLKFNKFFVYGTFIFPIYWSLMYWLILSPLFELIMYLVNIKYHTSSASKCNLDKNEWLAYTLWSRWRDHHVMIKSDSRGRWRELAIASVLDEDQGDGKHSNKPLRRFIGLI